MKSYSVTKKKSCLQFKCQDRLGSTTLITKEYGEKVKTLSYDAFIRLLPETHPFRAGVKNRSWRFFGKPRNGINNHEQ